MPHRTYPPSFLSILRRVIRRFSGQFHVAGLIDPALCEASDNALKRALTVLENWVAPKEYLAAIQQVRKRSPMLYERVLKQPAAFEIATATRVQRFSRTSQRQGGTFYRGPGKTTGKCLLVICAGYLKRPGMSVPAFLQRIDDTRFDVLMLKDPHKNHFRNGVTEETNSLGAIAGYIQELCLKNRYREHFVLGTSGGGFPAVRLALMTGADRAISFGGSFPDDTLRILRKQVRDIPAFDPICACLHANHTEITFVFSDQSPRYRNASLNGAVLTGGTVIEVKPVMEHAVLGPLWSRGGLDAFLPNLLATDFPQSITDKPNWSIRPQGGYLYSFTGATEDGV